MKNYKIKFEEVSDVLKTTDYIINKFGPRLPGSEACIKAAGQLKKEYERCCDKVYENNYTQYPDSFFYIPSIIAFAYFLGIFFFFIPHLIYLSIIFYVIGLVYLITQFIFFRNTFDKLFKKYAGKNVFGIIEPRDKLKQQIIISAHHDSPYICNFLSSNQKLYSFRLFLPIIFYLYAFLTSILLLISKTIRDNSSYYLVSLIIICIGCLLMLPLFWYNNRKGSPGAGDNLISSVIGIKVAEIIKKNFNSFAHTRIIVLSSDGEEIGLKGIQAFINQNKDLLKECKTFVLNIDSIFKYKDLSLLTSDRNGTIKLSNQLANEIIDISNQLGYSVQKKKLPFGGGGTDAAHFAKEGIESTSLIGISTNMIRDGLYYHSANDIVENLDPAAVEATINIAVNFVLYKDMIMENTV
jgi:hypothetical protein